MGLDEVCNRLPRHDLADRGLGRLPCGLMDPRAQTRFGLLVCSPRLPSHRPFTRHVRFSIPPPCTSSFPTAAMPFRITNSRRSRPPMCGLLRRSSRRTQPPNSVQLPRPARQTAAPSAMPYSGTGIRLAFKAPWTTQRPPRSTSIISPRDNTR